MIDPRDPYERYYWHYESRRPLSVAQIIALGSVNVETAGLIWFLIEHGSSLTVAGPTDPQPGVGKTTTLNALLQFLPEGTGLAYMSGMYENFAFTRLPDIEPENTYALCNEVSNHLQIYMWGKIARRYLTLPGQGYHIATSVHADTINDVMGMYQQDLRLGVEDVRRLGLVINIGLVGKVYPPRRRWFTTHFIQPHEEINGRGKVVPVPLSIWNRTKDTFEIGEEKLLEKIANWVGCSGEVFQKGYKLRMECLSDLAQGEGADLDEMYVAIEDVRKRE